MAIMEAAISKSLSHENIVSTYTYSLTPVREGAGPSRSSSFPKSTTDGADSTGTLSPRSSLHCVTAATAFEVRIVLEFCDRGTLREALSQWAFILPNGSVNYLAVLETAADIARGMAHLHSQGVLHSDLKVYRI